MKRMSLTIAVLWLGTLAVGCGAVGTWAQAEELEGALCVRLGPSSALTPPGRGSVGGTGGEAHRGSLDARARGGDDEAPEGGG